MHVRFDLSIAVAAVGPAYIESHTLHAEIIDDHGKRHSAELKGGGSLDTERQTRRCSMTATAAIYASASAVVRLCCIDAQRPPQLICVSLGDDMQRLWPAIYIIGAVVQPVALLEPRT
jgi:hypothetical protein